ncbi:TPA: SidC protein [Legionella pneumophila]|nr:SidC protein [Legionella pneumophila]
MRVTKMPKDLTFNEPDSCDYLYIDDKNKVHILLPAVAGGEIATDNTCKTVYELKAFFFGRPKVKNQPAMPSASEQLKKYKEALEQDISAIKAQREISSLAYQDLLKDKSERLEQINQYIQIIDKLASEEEIKSIAWENFPEVPKPLAEIIKESQNAFAIRLAPKYVDNFLRFDNPLFSLKRHSSHYSRIREGLGVRLQAAFEKKFETGELIHKKNPQEEYVEKMLKIVGEDTKIWVNKAKVNKDDADEVDEEATKENINQLIRKLAKETVKVDPSMSLEMSRDKEPMRFDGSYIMDIVCFGSEESTLKEWINAVLASGVDDLFWKKLTSSVFYDVEKITGDESQQKEAKEEQIIATMIKVEFLLGLTNFYCKTNNLSDINFGTVVDSEPHATDIANLVMEALGKGDDIEPAILNYINAHQSDFGLSNPLSEIQQLEITERFNNQYKLINGSDHYDEFFLMDPNRKGNIYSFNNRISCHLLDFLAKYDRELVPKELETHANALQEGVSISRLHHKNDLVRQGHDKVKAFRLDAMKLLKSKPEELVDFLVAKTPSGVPNYSMLSLEMQNQIAFSDKWSIIERKMDGLQNMASAKKDLCNLLSPANVNRENAAVISWETHSKKPLVEIELDKIAQGLQETVDKYTTKRGSMFWKGSKNKARHQQCEDLKNIAREINGLLEKSDLSKEEMLKELMKSAKTLDRIDREISGEWNLFKSSLQQEVHAFRKQLQALCQSDLIFKSDVHEEIQNEMRKQLAKINNQEVREIVTHLPTYCHSDTALNFFNELSLHEVLKVADYINLTYLDFSTVNKDTLLSQDIPNRFKEKNQALLDQLKISEHITEEFAEELSGLTSKIRPQLFTENNIKAWSTDLEAIEPSKHSFLLLEVSNVMALINSGDQNAIKRLVTQLEEFSTRLEKTKDRESLPQNVQSKLTEFESTLKESIRNAKTSQVVITPTITSTQQETGRTFNSRT